MILGNGKLNKPSLKVLRYRKGLAQGELADLLGVQQATVSHIETFRMTPSPKLHKKICEVLDLPEDFAIAYSNERKSVKKAATEVDDRVCMHYVVDRLDELIEMVDPAKVHKRLYDFKEELVYNLGVNTRIKRKGED
jgi:transcriptional regulator with XRE-family HTH domain